MMPNWELFFQPNTRVLALPNWRNPRLLLPGGHGLQRWQDSDFYPASRLLARGYRFSLRARAAAGFGETRQTHLDGWPLGTFVGDVLPQAVSAVVMVGTAGPAQKITAQIRDSRGELLAYLKYADKVAARARVRQECRLLRHIPDGSGPELIKCGRWGDGEALLMSVLPGQGLPTTLPPTAPLVDFSMSLAVSPPVPLEAHPWVRRMRKTSEHAPEPWFEALSNRAWPIVVQHGDFAPWNLLRKPGGALGAIDWEYGVLEGFPHLDLAYFVLQVSPLIYHQDPSEAAERTVRYLVGQPGLALKAEEARALTRLAAYDAYLKSREDGQPDVAGLQAWRRRIWESKAHGT
jgi:Phosphotransferase enzyme family